METVVADLEVEIALTGEYFMGQVEFADGFIAPGGCALASVRTWLSREDLQSLLSFGSWSIWEGPHHVGSARVLGSGANSSSKPTPLRGAA
jgi:hypothetical protein